MKPPRLLAGLCLGLFLFSSVLRAEEPVWQWSVPVGAGRAFLWIPPECARVRAVIVGQHNMCEEGILEHADLRRELGRLGIAEVWVAPPFDGRFDFPNGAGERFEAFMWALAEESGYTELAFAPVIPLGHSACASYSWNFAAWNPARTLAIISFKGDAPLTDLTGSGRPNPEWGDRRIDGVPGLMVMSEAEWWEARLTPLLRFRAAHPAVPLALLADTGHGHFDGSDALVEFLALFIRKAAAARLPAEAPMDRPVVLRPVDPAHGWLVDRWRREEPLRAPAAPAAAYPGDRAEAFWCFDEEIARATESYYATGRGKRSQQVAFLQDGRLAPISTGHAGVELKFIPRPDGVTFQLAGGFIAVLPPRPPVAAKDKPPAPRVVVPTAAAPGAHAPGSVRLSRLTGPVAQVDPETFCVRFNRAAAASENRVQDIWLLASHPGDKDYKSAVQQALMKIAPNTEGAAQTITFSGIPDQSADVHAVQLHAVSDAGLPVRFYVREGPAYIEGDTLHLTALPPRSRLPVTVTVVAWQFGRGGEARVKTATSVERSFRLVAGRR